MTSQDFFAYFPDLLRRLSPKGALGTLTAVPESYVPIIKLVFNGIEIDLIFVSIKTKTVITRDLSLNDNKLLDGLDASSIRSITGPRVTDEMLAAVPEQKTFRTALRAIKLWAQRRAIYANIVGFPGGVAWAILVARVCQSYPHALGATMVQKFFSMMKIWPWPDPVLLKNIDMSAGKEKVWNPAVYSGDKKNLMPIITPAYPSMCATYNISKSGKVVIMRELHRGSQITNQIFDPESPTTWRDLFRKHTFFTADHKYYLSVIASAPDQDSAKAWSGLVESKIRHLVGSLEFLSETINLARPFTKGFKRVHQVDSPEEAEQVHNGSTKYQTEETKTVETTDPELVTTNGEGAAVPEAGDTPIQTSASGKQKIHTITFYIGIDLTEKATKNLDISYATNDFYQKCREWEGCKGKDGIYVLKVIPCKNYELPGDLFDLAAGDVKPIKPAKAKKTSAVKRSFSEVDEAAMNGETSAKKPHMVASSVEAPAPTSVAT